MLVRQIRIYDDIAHLPLTRGMVALIDPEAASLVCDWNWRAINCGGKFYAGRTISAGGGKETVQYLHRYLAEAQPGFHVDHINGDTLDNRQENLRIATAAQNLRNKRKSHSNQSGFKGVTFERTTGKWRARIEHKGTTHSLGLFTTREEAHAAYMSAAQRLFGEFASAG